MKIVILCACASIAGASSLQDILGSVDKTMAATEKQHSETLKAEQAKRQKADEAHRQSVKKMQAEIDKIKADIEKNDAARAHILNNTEIWQKRLDKTMRGQSYAEKNFAKLVSYTEDETAKIKAQRLSILSQAAKDLASLYDKNRGRNFAQELRK